MINGIGELHIEKRYARSSSVNNDEIEDGPSMLRVYKDTPESVMLQIRVRKPRTTVIAIASLSAIEARELATYLIGCATRIEHAA